MTSVVMERADLRDALPGVDRRHQCAPAGDPAAGGQCPWLDDAAFAHTFAIASAAPGPNVIVVSLIGWQVAGWAGLLVATLAIMIPSCALAFFAARVLARWSDSGAVAILKAALVLLGLGLMLASGVSMMRTVDGDAFTVAISLATAAFVVASRRNPLWALAAGTCVNIIALHMS
ncbi:MAG TPA: chromate transporter [Reyranella sp.]|nr:chromate transporter [Reyranella sp.]